MARGHPWLPRRTPAVVESKARVLGQLTTIDNSISAKQRIYSLEAGFRTRITAHIGSLLHGNGAFADFNTSPFVLMIFALKNHYVRISEIEGDILPAKLFSSMETSAGRMVEDVALPVYGWSAVPSAMHTQNSALDGVYVRGSDLFVATLKSGPRCLNDEMVENFADAIINHGPSWVSHFQSSTLDFTYGVLYGTKKQSNKKDWHILRSVHDKLGATSFSVSPQYRWDCSFSLDSVPVTATVRVGKEWWDFLGGQTCLLEVCVALIRACVTAGAPDPANYKYTIRDLGDLVSLPPNMSAYNVGLLQQNQFPWLFLLLRHFCDDLQP